MSLLRLMSMNLLLALLFGATNTPAAIRTWPGAPPCQNFLQDCINGVDPGDVVEIASDQVIDESLVIQDRLVSLRAAEGVHPTLAASRSLIVDYSPSTTGLTVPFELEYSGLTLAGGRFEFTTTQHGSVHIERMVLNQQGSTAAAYIANFGTDTGSATRIFLRQNLVRASLDAEQAIFLGLNRPALVLIEDNLIESQAGVPVDSASRVAMHLQGTTGNGSIEVRRNRIVAQGEPGLSASRLRRGIGLAPFGTSAGFEVRIIDNLIDVGTEPSDTGIYSTVSSGSHLYDITNNTLLVPGSGIALYDGSAGLTALAARIRNNIIARPADGAPNAGITWTVGHPAISNDYNLLFNTVGDTQPLGPHTVIADPGFASGDDPRLLPISPAIDAGDYLAREALPHLGPVAALDNDGLRREIGTSVDLGAFEYGDQSFTHNASASAASTELSHPGLDENPAALMLITRSGGSDSSASSPSPGPLSQSYGEFTQRWSLISSDETTIEAGTGFTLRQLAPGGYAGIHIASAGNNFSSSGTSLGATWANLPTDWILLVSATLGASLSNTHDPHPFGAAHLNGAWRIINTDGAAMPNGSAFVVYAQEPSRNAFWHTVSAANLATPVVSLLDHPALNGVACADPHVVVSAAGQLPTPLVSARYEPSLRRWYLLNASPSVAMGTGDRYAIIIDPRSSADACRRPLFGDGFE